MATVHEIAAAPVMIEPLGLAGILRMPDHPVGLVVFAHGSGSGRLSPRNNHVAEGLGEVGLASLLLDLLTMEEDLYRANVFDIPLLAARLAGATQWAETHPATEGLPVGYFGASTGAGAALLAAAHAGNRIRAVVSRGGRPDLAGAALTQVTAPALLIVGSLDGPVIALNREALELIPGEKELIVVAGASHLFEEPGTLDEVIRHAARWFLAHLGRGRGGA